MRILILILFIETELVNTSSQKTNHSNTKAQKCYFRSYSCINIPFSYLFDEELKALYSTVRIQRIL